MKGIDIQRYEAMPEMKMSEVKKRRFTRMSEYAVVNRLCGPGHVKPL